MSMLETKATTPEEERVKKYLEENASDELRKKIDGGVVMERDGKQVLNLKTLTGFMKWACEEAKKQAVKGANAACVDDATVFGWAVHYFEEDSIIGTLYNNDGTEYKPERPVKTQVQTNIAPKVKTPPKQDYTGQQSIFDFDGMDFPTEDEPEETDESDEPEITDDTRFVATKKVAEPEPEKTKISPLYESYLTIQNQYPDAVVAKRIGDFYEVFGENAKVLSEELGLTLTGRDCGLPERVPMIGFPYHRIDVYFGKIRQNHRLVVMENDKEEILEKYVPVSDTLVDSKTGEIIEDTPKNTKQEAFNALLERSFDKEYLYDLYEKLDGKMDIR